MLEIRNLNAHYGHSQVLYDISIDVKAGEFVSIIGALFAHLLDQLLADEGVDLSLVRRFKDSVSVFFRRSIVKGRLFRRVVRVEVGGAGSHGRRSVLRVIAWSRKRR